MSPRDHVRTLIRGLYGLADADAAGGDPESLAAALLEGGCRLIQLRCKGWSPDDTLVVARAVRARCASVRATFIVNDHPELAVAADADGVHVGQLDAPTEQVRGILGPERILGRSTHDIAQLETALTDADYVAFGPVFQTENVSRPKGTRGIDALTEAAQTVAGRAPLVAIGGITPARLPAIVEAGADSWAVIGAIASASDRALATRALLGP